MNNLQIAPVEFLQPLLLLELARINTEITDRLEHRLHRSRSLHSLRSPHQRRIQRPLNRLREIQLQGQVSTTIHLLLRESLVIVPQVAVKAINTAKVVEAAILLLRIIILLASSHLRYHHLVLEIIHLITDHMVRTRVKSSVSTDDFQDLLGTTAAKHLRLVAKVKL